MERRTYLNAILKISRLFGFLPYQGKNSGVMNTLLKIPQFIYPASLLLMLVQTGIILLTTEFNLVEDAYKFLNVFIFLFSALYLVYYRIRHEKLCEMVKKMNENFVYAANGLEKKDMSKVIRWVDLLAYVWTFLNTSAANFVSINTILFSSERELPITAWYPFDWRTSPMFELAALHQIMINIIMSSCFGFGDLFIATICYTTAGQFRILETNFRNIVYSTLLEYGCRRTEVEEFARSFNEGDNAMKDKMNETIIEIMKKTDFNNQLQRRLATYVEHHRWLLDFFRDDVENFLSPILLLKLLDRTFFTVFLLYNQAANGSGNISFITSMGGYLFMVMLAVLFYSTCGELLYITTDNFLDNVYKFPWYICGKEFQKDILLVLLCGSKRIHLTAGKIIQLRLVTFTLILRSSFSYYTILKRTIDSY
ncbi:Odorant receptor Or112 [Rhyzopertha dominica]|nr:Odorant receptor Or112 [Rhyzopertha dominica]